MASNSEPQAQRPKIAVFSGPTATIQNSEPLVTSNKARKILERLSDDGRQPKKARLGFQLVADQAAILFLLVPGLSSKGP